MRKLLHAAAVPGFIVAGVLLLLAVSTWGSGGLFFGFPGILLLGALLLGAGSLVVFLLTRAPRQEDRKT